MIKHLINEIVKTTDKDGMSYIFVMGDTDEQEIEITINKETKFTVGDTHLYVEEYINWDDPEDHQQYHYLFKLADLKMIRPA